MPLTLAPEQVNEAVKLLCTPGLALAEIASRLGLHLASLADWLLLPDTEELITRIERAHQRHARLLAATALPAMAKALNQSVDDYQQVAASEPMPTADVKARTLRSKERDHARKAVGLLLKLAKGDAPPSRSRSARPALAVGSPIPTASPAPRAEAGENDLAELIAQAKAVAKARLEQLAGSKPPLAA